MKAFLYHFHGIGHYDFSELRPADLRAVQAIARERDLEILPTVYLRREALPRLCEVMAAYHELSEAGELPNIAGFAVEGPLLGPQGGIPRAGRWYPTAAEWERLSGLGPLGLRYLVMAPDALALDAEVEGGLLFSDLILDFYSNGLRLAVGHFHRSNPERSVERLEAVIEFLHGRYESSPYLILTDHLYNDMPRTFVHAWRTPEERARRAEELRPVLAPDWATADLRDVLGPVPAAVLEAARRRLLIPCLNFDGWHVDLDICRRTVDYLGAGNLIALTDHTEVGEMAGEQLKRTRHNDLWLRSDGLVAAGSLGYEQQRHNMLEIGLTEQEITTIFVTNPRAAIAYRPVRAVSGAVRP
jgi:hypothetical protein